MRGKITQHEFRTQFVVVVTVAAAAVNVVVVVFIVASMPLLYFAT